MSSFTYFIFLLTWISIVVLYLPKGIIVDTKENSTKVGLLKCENH